MTRHFIFKEIVEGFGGPRFLITFLISLVLIVTSVYTGYQLYQSDMRWYATAKAENVKALTNLGTYEALKSTGTKAMRRPTRMSIFVRGVDSSIGKASTVNEEAGLVLRDSRFGLNPIFAVFGELDLTFIVTIIMSLFALLFSYNAISGERELGTLKQILSNSVGRAPFIIGKSVGGLVSLALILFVPFLIALLMLMLLFGVSFTGDETIRLALLATILFAYLAVFYMIGMFMSALSRSSFISFLLCLFIWVLSVAIVPRISVEVAGQISPAPSIDRVEAEQAAMQREYYQDLKNLVNGYFKEAYDGNPANFGNAFQTAWKRAMQVAQQKKAEREEPILQAYERDQLNLLNTAQAIARFSPTSCATFATGHLAYTDAELRERFLKSLRRYRENYLNYADEKMAANPDKSEGGVSISMTRGNEGPPEINVTVPEYTLEVADLPEFKMDRDSVGGTIVAVAPDIAILVIEIIFFFALAFVAFLRYDVR
jgi:ABC-type transport system involved in multi-copper enzyme maturation permease subunit